MEKEINKSKIIITFILIILIPVLVFYLFKILNPESLLFSIDEEIIQQFVHSWGIYGPIIFILIQTFTVIFPPTPNLVAMIASGILFGTLLGILYSFIGVMAGVTLNFYLTRLFGRKIIKKILNKNELDTVDKFAKKVNWRVIAILPFIPGMYADLGGYSAGLSNINFKKYFFSIGLGYLMLVSLANLLGKFIIQNPVLRGILILILLLGLVSIFLIPLIRFITKKFRK